MSISRAARDGDQIKLLQEMRDRITDTLFDRDCHPRDLASLSRRLQEIGKDIAALEGGEQDSVEQLKVLKDLRSRLAQAADDPECLPRDLATLTRRLQDIGKDITTLDARAGNQIGGNTNDSGDSKPSGDQPFDPSEI